MDSAGQQVTLAWLASAFELHDGASLARREVYKDYVEFCQRVGLNPTTAAIFGKLVRVVFPTVSSRRLGRRGANVVHYYNFRRKPIASSSSSSSSSSASSSSSSTSTSSSTSISPKAPAVSPGTTDLNPISSLVVSPASTLTITTSCTTVAAKNETSGGDGGSRSFGTPQHSEFGRPQPAILSALSHQRPSNKPGATPDQLQKILGKGALASSTGSYFHTTFATPVTVPTTTKSAVLQPFAAPFPPVPAAFNFETALAFPTFQNDQKMDDPYTLASSAQARVNAPSVSPSQLLKRGQNSLWSVVQHGHLHAMALAAHYMHHYRHSYYVQCPLHPAALEENNVRYVLCTREGSEERSALSLNVYYALCLGALISGHIPHAREFFQTTKDHLSEVFDMTDYSVAQALVPMGFSERFFARDEAEGWRVSVYYLTLANQICRRLGALASDVYSRCSKAVFFMEDVDTDPQSESSPESNEDSAALPPPLSSRQDVSWEEIIQTELNFHQQIQRQKQRWLNYSRPRRAHKTLYAILFAIVDLMDAMNNLEKLRQTALAKRQRQSLMPPQSTVAQTYTETDQSEEEREYTKTREDGRMLARLLGLLAPDAAKRLEGAKETNRRMEAAAAASGQGALLHRDAPSASSSVSTVATIEESGLGARDVSRIAQYFTDQLLLLEEELLVLYQGTEIGERYLSVQSYQMTKIFIYGLRVENRWIAGDRNATLALIMNFLELHRRERHNLMLFENKPVFQRVLDILNEMGRHDIMRQLLYNLEPLARVAPIFATMYSHYSQLASD